MSSGELRFTAHDRGANFTLASGAVPALTPETLNLNSNSEMREIVEASIAEVQGRKKIAMLEQQFALEINDNDYTHEGEG